MKTAERITGKRATITVNLPPAKAPTAVPVVATVYGNLALHQATNRYGELPASVPRYQRWTITHIPSGMACGYGPTRAVALERLQAMLEVSDWAFRGDDDIPDGLREAVYAIHEHEGN